MAPRWKQLAAVLTTAFVLRAAVPLLAMAIATPAPQWREPDTAAYIRAADELWNTGRLGTPERPEFIRTPGYPLLLLPGVAVGHLVAVTVALQVVLGCATVWFVYLTARVVLGNDRCALAAAWLMACDPVSIIYCSKLLTETCFSTFLSADLWRIARYANSRRWSDLLFAAIVMAASAYVRPIVYFLPIWTGLVMVILFWRGDADRRRLLLHATAFVAIGMGLMAPWQIRNFIEAGYSGFAAISDVNLYYYEALPAIADQQQVPAAEMDRLRIEEGEGSEEYYLLKHPEQREWSQAERFRFLRKEAIHIIRSDPLGCIRLHFSGIVYMLTDSGRNAWLAFFRLADTSKSATPLRSSSLWDRLTTAIKHKPLMLAIHGLLAVTLFAYLSLAAIGLVSPTSRTPATLMVLAVGLYLLLISGGLAAYHRFRIPLVPVICLSAVAGYDMLVRWRRRRHA
jgi:hypothetical protein